MIEFRKKKQTDGIKLLEKPRKQEVKVDTQKVREDAQERSKEQSLFQRFLNFFKKDKHYSEIVVNGLLPNKRVACLVDGTLESLEMDTCANQQMFGAIFKGKIQNLEPGLKAAFVDIGQEKNAFLHYWDVLPLVNGEGFNESNTDDGIEVVHKNTDGKPRQKVGLQDIPEMFPIGSSIVVQISKSQIGTKGPRTTTNISLPGRYIVLTPYSNQCGISRKIEDRHERERLKKILRKLTLPLGMGIILRTASSGSSLKQLTRDLQFLLETWQKIQKKVDNAKEPCLVYHEPSLLERTVRDLLTEDVDRVIVDNEADYNFILDLLAKIAPNVQKKVTLFKDPIPVFDRYNVEAQIEQMFASRVPLPSGGEIVIQETEALTSIDVNTSSHKISDDESSNFILQANLEAAREVARQVRLRNIGGLIIVDFVDMKQAKHRRILHQYVQEEFGRDKARSHVLPISALGIMQITRQRHKESMLSQLYSRCPYCGGEGVLKSSWNLAMRMQREILSRVFCLQGQVCKFKIILNPYLKNYIITQCLKEFNALEEQFHVELNFQEDNNLHVENFKIVQE